MKNLLSIIVSIALCSCATHKPNNLLSFYSVDKSSNPNYPVELFKLDNTKLTKHQLTALELLKVKDPDLFIIPDSLHRSLFFSPEIPYSPSSDMKFIISKSDTLKVYLSTSSKNQVPNLIYSGFLENGYYSLGFDFEEGIYPLILETKDKSEILKYAVIK